MTVTTPDNFAAEHGAPPDADEVDAFVFPASFAQQRLWFLNQLKPDSAFYNVVAALRLSGGLDAGALEQSFAEIMRRHESLRTTFASEDGKPVQVIHVEAALPLGRRDLSNLPAASREEAVRRLILEDVRRPFDLKRGPLWRALLVRTGEDEHVLAVTMHHIITDGWSVAVLVREAAALYEAFSEGRFPQLPELTVQYADYAAWQREWLQGDLLARQLAYWKEKLADAPGLLELPADRPRPAAQTFRGAHQTIVLSQDLAARLRALSQQEGCTLFMTLLAGFKALLWRYTGREDIVVGTDVAGRNRAETEEIIGFFVNQLVLRTDVSGEPSFAELLGRVRKVATEAYAHQDVPFDKLVEVLNPERSLQYSPLFQAKLVLQNVPRAAYKLAGLSLTELEVDGGTTTFDLTLNLAEREEGICGWFEYNADLFEAATIERLAAHYERLLAGACDSPRTRLGGLPLLGEGERAQLLTGWNRTEAKYPRGACLHELFEGRARLTPEAVAVADGGGESLTYAELDRRADAVARRLRRLGVGPERVVGVLLERGVGMVAALLGVLKAGGAYLPLDPEYPEARLAFMLEDSGVGVLLTTEHLQERLPALWAHVVCLDSDEELFDEDGAEPAAAVVHPENPAYVIYTSGSTGRPKGVIITHRAICNHMHWMLRDLPLDASDVVIQKTPFSFDASVWEFFAPLLAGASVLLARPGGHQDSAYLTRLMAERGVTVLQVVPSLLRLLLEEPGLKECHALRRVCCGGEALTADLVERFERTSGRELFNLYGPTEAAIDTVFCRVDGRVSGGRVPLGRPVSNTRAYLLDAHLQPVPRGVVGELYLGGESLGRGYLKRPGLTAERFLPDPYADAPGERMYRTGDLARHLPDGELQFVGRVDQQVKVRGFRIELGEIEAVLSSLRAVAEAAVVPQGGDSGDGRLVAYVVGRDGAPNADELREQLAELLPDYMIPSVFVALDSLPQTPSGKVDRRALPEPGQERPALSNAFAEAQTPTERALVGLWREVLGIEEVGVSDNFFDLGGHSLLATQLLSRIYGAFNVRLTLQHVFEHPTVAQLARALDAFEPEPDAEPDADYTPPEVATDEWSLERLSDEEVASMLKKMIAAESGDIADYA